MEPSSWYSGGAPLLRLAVIVGCAYAALLVLRRSTGARGLSELTAADLAAAVALGVTIAVVVISPQLPAVEAVLALALIVGLHALLGGGARDRPAAHPPAELGERAAVELLVRDADGSLRVAARRPRGDADRRPTPDGHPSP